MMWQKTKQLLFLCLAFLCISTASAQKIEEQVLPKELHLNNGKTIKLADLKGKVVLFDFWYRGCFPCLKAIPGLIELQEEFKDDLVIIGINDVDTKEDITDYYAYKNVNYFSTYKSNTNIAKELKTTAFPTTILINQNTEIVNTEVGFQSNFKRKLRKTIKKLIKEQQ